MLDRTMRAANAESAARRPSRGAGERPTSVVETDVDLGPLGERLGYFLRRAQVAIFQDFDTTCRAFNIRPVQYSILTIIERNPGLSQTRVSDVLGIKKTNFVAMLDTLEGRGLVRRTQTPGDRRTYSLFLTQDGKVLMRRLHKLVEAHENRLVKLIGPEMHRRMFAPLKAIAELTHVTKERK